MITNKFYVLVFVEIFCLPKRERSLVVSDLRLEAKDSWYESCCSLYAEVISLQLLYSKCL